MDPFNSALIFDDLMRGQRRTPTLCPEYKKRWKVWLERHTSSLWTSKVDFGMVRMATESQQYTTFTVGNPGFYEFTRMPFGLCNAPTTFQRLMQNMLGRVEFDLLHHLSGPCDSIRPYGERTPRETLDRIGVFP